MAVQQIIRNIAVPSSLSLPGAPYPPWRRLARRQGFLFEVSRDQKDLFFVIVPLSHYKKAKEKEDCRVVKEHPMSMIIVLVQRDYFRYVFIVCSSRSCFISEKDFIRFLQWIQDYHFRYYRLACVERDIRSGRILSKATLALSFFVPWPQWLRRVVWSRIRYSYFFNTS